MEGTERLALVTFGFLWRVQSEEEAISRAAELGGKIADGMRFELDRRIEFDDDLDDDEKEAMRALIPKLYAVTPAQVTMLPEEVISGP